MDEVKAATFVRKYTLLEGAKGNETMSKPR